MAGSHSSPDQSPRNASISEATIRAIVRHSLPNAPGDIVVEQQHPDPSNDRVFAVSCGLPRQQCILKLVSIGAKVETEVGCMLLNQTFCPGIPVPRVISWSSESGVISRLKRDGKVAVTEDEQLDVPGWILMTRLQGKPLDVAKLTPAQQRSIISQLARITLSWRRDIPWSAWAGDIRFSQHEAQESTWAPSMRTPSLPKLYIYGLQGMGKGIASPMGSMLHYWQSDLRCLVDELDNEEVFAPIRESLSAKLRDCIEITLPRLSVLRRNQKHEFVFTHTDLAPRNILVSEYYPSIITGVVGFGFSGFFPTWSQFFAFVTNDELLTEESNENPDWPADMYKSFVKLLVEQGVATPFGHESSREWKELANLMKIEIALCGFDGRDKATAVKMLKGSYEEEFAWLSMSLPPLARGARVDNDSENSASSTIELLQEIKAAVENGMDRLNDLVLNS